MLLFDDRCFKLVELKAPFSSSCSAYGMQNRPWRFGSVCFAWVEGDRRPRKQSIFRVFTDVQGLWARLI